jgi:hypothetical protein
MAERKSARTDQSAAGETRSDVVEQKVVELAEQLGWFLGTVRAKADGWLDRESLRKELGRIRDGAAELLDHVNRGSESARKAAARRSPDRTSASLGGPGRVERPAAAAPKARASRGAVDAPGKSHRKPPPQEALNKRMGEPVGKQMGQKSFKVGKSRGRG